MCLTVSRHNAIIMYVPLFFKINSLLEEIFLTYGTEQT